MRRGLIFVVAAATVLWGGVSSFAVEPTNTGNASPETKYKIDRSAGGKLVTTTAKVKVLAAPEAKSRVLHEYEEGAMMAILGEATDTGYLYVSPCNACDAGFVAKAELPVNSRP